MKQISCFSGWVQLDCFGSGKLTKINGLQVIDSTGTKYFQAPAELICIGDTIRITDLNGKVTSISLSEVEGYATIEELKTFIGSCLCVTTASGGGEVDPHEHGQLVVVDFDDPFNPPADACEGHNIGDTLVQGGAAPNFDFVWSVVSDGEGGCVLVCKKAITNPDANTSK